VPLNNQTTTFNTINHNKNRPSVNFTGGNGGNVNVNNSNSSFSYLNKQQNP
jgi:hypothetical protein